MGRTVKDAKLDSREARLKLKERADREPHWRLIHQGLHLGYRKGTNGSVWLVRLRDGERYIKKVIARTDDMQDSNGKDVLSFREAQSVALTFTAPKISSENLTVSTATEQYMQWFVNNRKGYSLRLLSGLMALEIPMPTQHIRNFYQNLIMKNGPISCVGITAVR